MRHRPILSLILCGLSTLAYAAEKPGITWTGWTDDVFARAQKDRRLVILDLEAVWCHWCHVMDDQTYSDPDVQKLIQDHFIAVRVDQDARPDLSNRYERYGWPATILFDSRGQELAKRAGFIPPKAMASMLAAFVKDPTPGPSIDKEPAFEPVTAGLLTADQQAKLEERYHRGYDREHGSWGFEQKYLDWDGVELALRRAKKGDADADTMARQTLDQQAALLDPVWGGVYQYSTGGDWKSPHFEKIMSMQAENLRIYALAYGQYHDVRYRHMAEAIAGYLKSFLLSPEGAFYTSQDADLADGKHSAAYFALSDTARRQQGIPRIDKHVYARENGWAIRGFVALYAATGDPIYLGTAEHAAKQVLDTRSHSGGGFRHDAIDAAGPYLGDSLAMGRAFLDLYAATGDRLWLTHAEAALQFIAATFPNTTPAGMIGGYTTTARKAGTALVPAIEPTENVALARFAQLAFQYSGRAADHAVADNAAHFIFSAAGLNQSAAAPLLLAQADLAEVPLHLTIVGAKFDPAARALFTAALRYPATYKRTEWWDPDEGPLPNTDVEYPPLRKAGAFICAHERCSLPIYDPAQMTAKIDAL